VNAFYLSCFAFLTCASVALARDGPTFSIADFGAVGVGDRGEGEAELAPRQHRVAVDLLQARRGIAGRRQRLEFLNGLDGLGTDVHIALTAHAQHFIVIVGAIHGVIVLASAQSIDH